MKSTRRIGGTTFSYIRRFVVVAVCGIGVSTFFSHKIHSYTFGEEGSLDEGVVGKSRLSLRSQSYDGPTEAMGPQDVLAATSARVAELEGLLREARSSQAQAAANISNPSLLESRGGRSLPGEHKKTTRFKADAEGAADCDRGVECDLYDHTASQGDAKSEQQQQPFHAATLGLSDISHQWPLPPYTDPSAQPKDAFKGVYRCDVNTGCPTYSAAFLASKRQLLGVPITETHLNNKIANMESASYHLFGPPGSTAVWTSVDAFDFAVEHISMYERVLKSTEMESSPLRNALLAAYFQRLTLIERDQRLRCSEGPLAERWHAERPESSLTSRTVAVMPFYAVGAGSGHSIRDTKLKYLNITVHSICCHFDAVVVAVSHPLDEQYVLHQSGLPIHDVIMHTKLPRPSSTGMFTILRIQEKLKSDPKWANFDYVFYTEADQILHLRTTQVFSPLLPELASDPANGRSRNGWPDNGAALPAMVVPHRFHSVPTASDFAHVDAVHNSTAVYETMVQANRPESALKLLQEKLNIRTEMGKEKEEGRRRQQHTSRGGGHNGKRAESPVVSDFEGGGGGSSSSSGGEGGGVSGALLGASTAGGVGTYVDVNAYQWYHPSIERGTIRRELDLYETRNFTRFDAVNGDDSCCFLRAADDQRHGVVVSKNSADAAAAGNEEEEEEGRPDGGIAPHGSFSTPIYFPNRNEHLRPKVNDGVVEMMAVGNGFAMVAGDCCFICVFRMRYCHTTCTPRRSGEGDCAQGSFGER